MTSQLQPLLPTTESTALPAPPADVLRVVEATPGWLQEWQHLDTRLESPYLTCSTEWTRAWLRHYGDLVPHRIAVQLRGDVPQGMCLLTNGVAQYDGPFAVKTLHVGTAGEPDTDSICVEYNRLLVAPAQRRQFAGQLMGTISPHESWEYFVLDGMSQADAEAFLELQTPTSMHAVPSYYCDLNLIRTAQREPWRLFGESTRANLRRSLRDLGKVELDWADSPEEALVFYDEMIVYHQSRWNAVGKPGAFASQRFCAFHRDLIVACLPQQRVALVRARQQDRVLGLLYLLIEDNRLMYYQAGLPEHQSKLSLGIVTQYLTMLEGARRGYDAFDFMAGDAQYKRVLSTGHQVLYWARWRRPSVKFMVLDSLRTIKSCWRSK